MDGKSFIIYSPFLTLVNFIKMPFFLIQGEFAYMKGISTLLWIGRILFFSIFSLLLFYNKKNLDVISRATLIIMLFSFLVPATILPWYILWWLILLIIKERQISIFFWTAVGLFSYACFYSVGMTLLTLLILAFIVLRIIRTQYHLKFRELFI
jgi:hypothetical protein